MQRKSTRRCVLTREDTAEAADPGPHEADPAQRAATVGWNRLARAVALVGNAPREVHLVRAEDHGSQGCAVLLRGAFWLVGAAHGHDPPFSPGWRAGGRADGADRAGTPSRAPPNWLGHVAVSDGEAWMRKLIAAGGEPLGPVRRDGRGDTGHTARPYQEVIGLSSRGDGPSRAVLWHERHTTDVERVLSTYVELFSFRAAGSGELSPEFGTYRTFS